MNINATIAKRFTFDAAHRLDRLPPEHKCHRMHGHTYEVELVLRGPIDANGFVVDYADIEAAWRPIFETIDHRVLNEVPGLEIPSTEVLAVWILNRLMSAGGDVARLLWKVRIKESSTTWCEVSKSLGHWLADELARR